MAKYSEEFKVKVVTENIDGNLSYRSLACRAKPPVQTMHQWRISLAF
ncbi:MAG: hypothetical protein ACQEWU_21675 [Bacillota bacterium]|uniref:Transposase n=1 Tax=Virgibacillus salarius TaxID=447199 RepID=A0A941E084_9BACI|nr:hypothetical protein [Virgibacillus salarius]MBR7798299.1 hypothetical protein [Virgibacillus salarius]NAZ11008.1 hypothetical protein [Agaribacter marinus]WBX82099.1 hypothetical protein PD280_11020 [Virgibacillus salarius]